MINNDIDRSCERQPHDCSSYLAAHAPFLPRSFVDKLSEYKRKYDAYSCEMAKWEGAAAEAEINQRREAARVNPTPENLAALSAESAEETGRRYAERFTVLHQLREATVREFATPLSRQLLPVIEILIAEFRARVDREFRTVFAKYSEPYNPAGMVVFRAIDHWVNGQRQTLRREELGLELRMSPDQWHNLLPRPDDFHGICAGNLTPVDDTTTAPAAQVRAKTAADVANARAA